MDNNDLVTNWLSGLLVKAERGTAAALALHLGLTADKVSKAAHGKRRLAAEELVRIANFFEVEPPGFLKRLLPTAPADERPSGRGRERLFRVPVLNHISAGRLTEAVETPPSDQVLILSGLSGGDYFALVVRGDSMDRYSPENSIIIVDRSERKPRAGLAYVFSVRGEATYKMWQPDPARLEPWSTNPANKPIFVKSKRDLVVVGRVRRTILDL